MARSWRESHRSLTSLKDQKRTFNRMFRRATRAAIKNGSMPPGSTKELDGNWIWEEAKRGE